MQIKEQLQAVLEERIRTLWRLLICWKINPQGMMRLI